MSDSLAGVLPGTTGFADQAMPGVAGSAGLVEGTGTGQHGVAPILGQIGGGVGTAFQSVWDWLNTPFKTPLRPTDIFLLIGIVIVGVILWNIFLYHIRIAAETI